MRSYKLCSYKKKRVGRRRNAKIRIISGGSRAIDYASGEKRKIMSRTLRIKH